MPTKRQMLSYLLVRFLAFHNKLEGLVSFVAVWWGLWTLVFHDFWAAWPVTQLLTDKTHGHPNIISYALLVSGTVGYLSKIREWPGVRSVCFVTMFVCWGVLTIVFLSVRPVFSPGVACYSAFAISTLISYVSFQIGLEMVATENKKRGW